MIRTHLSPLEFPEALTHYSKLIKGRKNQDVPAFIVQIIFLSSQMVKESCFLIKLIFEVTGL